MVLFLIGRTRYLEMTKIGQSVNLDYRKASKLGHSTPKTFNEFMSKVDPSFNKSKSFRSYRYTDPELLNKIILRIGAVNSNFH